MHFGQDEERKRTYLSVDSRAIPHNPLYKAFKTKSFTDNDVMLHFYLMDLLSEEEGLTMNEIIDELEEEYFCDFDVNVLDESTIRKKLKEYEQLGLVEKKRQGRESIYRKVPDEVNLDSWKDAVSFYSEAAPLGVIGSYLLDKYENSSEFFRFKHHHLMKALDSEILYTLLDAIMRHAELKLTMLKAKKSIPVIPFRIYISTQYGKQYLGTYTVVNDQGAQDAHEAIRPTNLAYTPERVKDYLSSEQYRLYRMIYARAVASLMANAVYNQLSISLERNGCTFTSTGSTLDFDGYLKVYGDYDSSKDVILPTLCEGEILKDAVITPNQHFTEPPARYTEAKLIKALEEDGIGRPSTYAMIIDTIQIRGYVTLDRVSEKSRTKVFRPTDQGILTTEKLDEYFSSIINVDYTAQMEQKLDEIAEGKQEEVATLRSFYDTFTPLLDKAYQDMEKIAPEKTGKTCPECGGDLVYRNGRFGRFISCSNFPKCKYTAQMEKEGKEKPEPTGRMCPECGKELLKRKSRFGSFFLGCSGFPKCTYMENLEGERIYSRKEKLKLKEQAEAAVSVETEEKPKKKTAKKTSAAKKTTTKKKTSSSTGRKTTTRKKKTDEVAG